MSPPRNMLRLAALVVPVLLAGADILQAQSHYGHIMVFGIEYSGNVFRYGSLDDARSRTNAIGSASVPTGSFLNVYAFNDPISPYQLGNRTLMVWSQADLSKLPLDPGFMVMFDDAMSAEDPYSTPDFIETLRTGWNPDFTTFIISATGRTDGGPCCTSSILSGPGLDPVREIYNPEDGLTYRVPVQNGLWLEYSLQAQFLGVDPTTLDVWKDCGRLPPGWDCIGSFDTQISGVAGSFQGIFDDGNGGFYVADFALIGMDQDPETRKLILYAGDTVVPEPATFALVGAGLAGLLFASRRRRRLV